MNYLLIAAIVGFVVLLLIVIIVVVVINLIRKSVKQVANRAIDGAMNIGAGIAGQATQRVLDIGESEIREGIGSIKEVVGKEMIKSDPRRMATEVTKLAKANGGELTFSKVMADMSISKDLAQTTLDTLVRAKVCFLKQRGEESAYIFPAFKKKSKIKVCEYCDSIYTTPLLNFHHTQMVLSCFGARLDCPEND